MFHEDPLGGAGYKVNGNILHVDNTVAKSAGDRKGSKDIWWKNGTCYQIWPASFKDSNGDGMGDIQGVISSLDYIRELGIDFIWLSPMYDSPQHDMGYDISNYEDVWSGYGTLQDMDQLIKEVHSRGMRLILDLVVNHTSDEHDWFRESRKSKTNKYSDWYIWRDPKIVNGIHHPPNNWRAAFGGTAWHYTPERNQYYLHLFTQHQPDLNWENPATRTAIYKTAIEFWLEKGIDGFRVDTVNLYSKNTTYPNAPTTDPTQPHQNAEEHYVNGPRMHEWLQEQRAQALDKYGEDVFLVGELPSTKLEDVHRYVSSRSRELDCVFDFGICETGGRYGRQPHETWEPTIPELKVALRKGQDILRYQDAWGTVFGENHDQARSVSLYGSKDPRYVAQSGRLLAMLFASLSGTLFIYQGQEIGMTNLPADVSDDFFQDVCGRDYLASIRSQYPSDEAMLQKARQSLARVGRDNARTPVQWDGSRNAGFTKAEKSWMPVNQGFEECNVERARRDPSGVWAMWREMLRVRKAWRGVLVHGGFEVCEGGEGVDERVFGFLKTGGCNGDGDEVVFLVVLNFSDEGQGFCVPKDLRGRTLEVVVGNYDSGVDVGTTDVTSMTDGTVTLRPWEGRILRVI